MTTYPKTDLELKELQNGTLEILQIKEGWSTERNLITSLHRHNFHEILWLTHGSDRHMVDFKEYVVQGPAVLCIPKGSVHHFLPSIGTVGWKLIFDDSLFTKEQLLFFHGVPLFVPALGNKMVTLDKEGMIFLTHSLTTLSSMAQRMTQQGVLLNLIAFLNAIFLSQNTMMDTVFVGFLRLLGQEIYVQKDLIFYADALKISQRQLNTIVKRATGLTGSQYIQGRLVNEAKSKLLYTTMSIKEIAISLGYEDPLYFSRFFKKKTAQSPLDFRKSKVDLSM